MADGELEGGDRVIEVAVEGGAPLDVEADDEFMEAVPVDGFDLRDPTASIGWGSSNKGIDLVIVEVYVVRVVQVVGYFNVVIYYAQSHGYGYFERERECVFEEREEHFKKVVGFFFHKYFLSFKHFFNLFFLSLPLT